LQKVGRQEVTVCENENKTHVCGSITDGFVRYHAGIARRGSHLK